MTHWRTMKGKKLDIEFITTFITDCVSKGHTSKQEIYEVAKEHMAQCEAQIDDLKHRLLGCHDVLASFKDMSDRALEQDTLSFFALSNKSWAHHICQNICSGINDIDQLQLPSEALFALLSQMQDLKILSIHDGMVHKNERFEQFSLFLDKYYGQY